MQQTTEIKTIDINAKEWFDKVNGNSYFSVCVTINYSMPDQQIIKVPFQYGYGDSYRYAAFKALQDANLIPKQDSLTAPWRYYDANGIICRDTKYDAKKKDVIAWGKN